MRKSAPIGFAFVLSMLVFAALAGAAVRERGTGSPPTPLGSEGRISRGFAIAPVPLDLKGKNPPLVGLGSYIVNAIGACNDCHTCPSFEPGHNPFAGGDGKINAANYLAGGVSFGPVVSKNITPDDNGLPAGLTREDFIEVIRSGRDPDEGHVLQVMPWPIFRNMTDRELSAIYEYLRSIPHAEPGDCSFPGE